MKRMTKAYIIAVIICLNLGIHRNSFAQKHIDNVNVTGNYKEFDEKAIVVTNFKLQPTGVCDIKSGTSIYLGDGTNLKYGTSSIKVEHRKSLKNDIVVDSVSKGQTDDVQLPHSLEKSSVYPTLTKGIVTIDLPNYATTQSITIYNNQGMVVYNTVKIEGNIQTVDLSLNPTGLYFIVIKIADTSQIFTIVLEE
jgi:hypothetical protein